MTRDQIHLLKIRRFLPLFLTQALGALNDNLFRNALIVLIVFRLAETQALNAEVLVTVATGLFMLPFFLFSATAGQIADRTDKATMIRWVKTAEIAIMGLAAAGFWWNDPYVLIGVLFLMGSQSAFFGPVKYSILPDHLSEDELIGGNALIETGTYLAILLGTILGGLLILRDGGVWLVSAGLLGLAVAGRVASHWIPRTPVAAPELHVNPNVLAETRRIIGEAASRRELFLSILGISWFWLIGVTFLAQFPALARNVLGADEGVVTLFLTLFSIGIGLGSLLCNRLLNGEVSARYVPFGALGVTLFVVDLYFASHGAVAGAGPLIGVAAFLSEPWNWRIVADLLGIAVCGGLFIVPLYAILQSRSDADRRSQVIAANNIVNALFMVAGTAVASLLLAAGMPIPDLFLVVGVVNGVVAVYVCGLLPDAVIKAFLVSLLKLLYRVEVRGSEHYAKAGKRAVVVVNHVSFLDAVLLAAFLPVKPMFAVDREIAKRWWVRPFLRLIDAFPMDPTNPMATKSLIHAVREDRHCVIFPEGRITVTGSLMKVYEGPGMVADKADALVVPVRIDGAQFTHFSRLKGKVRIRWFPKITLTILPPRHFDIPDDLLGRARRRLAGARLYEIMSDMLFETCDRRQTLFEALLDARAAHGGGQPVLDDIERKPLAYRRLILGALVLGRVLAKRTRPGENVGLLLPNAAATAVTFFALSAFGRVPAMLNFTSGLKTVAAAVDTADIRTVLTSRRFVEAAGLETLAEGLAGKVDLVYLEDLRAAISPLTKLWAFLIRPVAGRWHRGRRIGPDDPAVVLFTSGSEGTPKGVVLSHANLLANRYQIAARVDFNPTDVVLNALPLFHSFGLTGGLLLPVLSGIRTFLYPSPLHYRIVPAVAYDINATIMFGTDTFLAGYARSAHPYDFYSLRYVFAGAEKVQDETRRVWVDTFGLRILEGYGATETAPVIAVNTPMHYRPGSVGQFLPAVDWRLEPVPGIDAGGRLFVRGPNVMLGYLRAEAPGRLDPPADGWYDTGDIVAVDDDGYVFIRGRAKRFAKIAGEMVSLGAVEDHAAAVWPDGRHAAVGRPDPRKGEQLVLVTEQAGADRAALLDYAKAHGIAELAVPRDIRVVDAIPLLGTGKVDYPRVHAMVEEATGDD